MAHVDLNSAMLVKDQATGAIRQIVLHDGQGRALPPLDVVGGPHPHYSPVDPKPRLPPPDKFDGNTAGSIKNVSIWCTDMLRYVQRTGIDVADAMAALTTGRARELVDMMLRDPTATNLSAADFLSTFAAHFSGQTQPAYLQARDKLHTQAYIMRPGQSLADYVLNFKQIMIEAGHMAEADRIQWFQQGLLPELRAECLTDGLASAFVSLDALIQHAFAQDRKLQCRHSAAAAAYRGHTHYPTLAVADADWRNDAMMQGSMREATKPNIPIESRLPELQQQQYPEYRDSARSVRGRGHQGYIMPAPSPQYHDSYYNRPPPHMGGRGRGYYGGRGRGPRYSAPRRHHNYAPEPAWHQPHDPYWPQPYPEQPWNGPPPPPPAYNMGAPPPPPPRPGPSSQQQPAAGNDYETARQRLAEQFKACPRCLEIHPHGPCPVRSNA
jgi:hypothetical protein